MDKTLFRWLLLSCIICLSSLSGVVGEKATAGVSFTKSYPSQTSPAASSQDTAQIQQIAIGEKALSSQPLSPTSPVGNEWGKAKQVDEHTWTIQVGEDAVMATPQEILSALNTYRQRHGRGALMWDDRLGEYAKSRSDYFLSTGKLDGHAGFSDYLDNQDGFTKLGFRSVGENSSLGYRQSGVHLIEWVYAGDKPHDDNQLDSKWHFVGIGVSATATDLIFGGEKL